MYRGKPISAPLPRLINIGHPALTLSEFGVNDNRHTQGVEMRWCER